MIGLDRRAVAGQLIAGRWRVSTELSRTDQYNAYAVRSGDGTLGRMVVMGTEVATRAELWAHCVQAARSASTPAMAEIPSVLDDGIDETLSSPYLVTEYVTWPTLSEHVSTSAGLSPQDWASVLGALAPALDAAHRRGVVHRGLTPNALLVSEESLSSVKILDFGLGVLRAAIPPPPGWAGPPGWVGPDGADPAVRPTPATDVFALGLVTFYALTGRPAFRALSQPAIDYDALWREMIEPLGSASLQATEFGLRLDPNLDEWFARALAPQPRQRFGSIGAMARAFGETLKKLDVTEGEPPAAERRPRKKTLVGPGPAPEPPAAARPPPLPMRASQARLAAETVEPKRRVATPEPAPRVATPEVAPRAAAPEALVDAPPSDKTGAGEARPGIVSVSVQPLAFAQLPGRASDPEVIEQPPAAATATAPAPASPTIAQADASPAELVSRPGRAPMPTVPEVEDAPLSVMAAQRGPSGWLITLLLAACFLVGGGAAALLWKQQRDARVAETTPLPAAEPTPSALVVAPPVPLPEAAAGPTLDAAADQTSAPIAAADASADAAADAAVRGKPRVTPAPARPTEKPAPAAKPVPTAKPTPTERPAPTEKPKAAPTPKPMQRPKKEEEPCGTFINPCK